VSTRQLAANRANAAKSTGPKTAAGKAASRGNATRHAILSADLAATHDEDARHLDALRADFAAELAPVGPLEAALCDRVVSALWRLRRVQAAEVRVCNDDAKYEAEPFTASRDTFATLTRYEVTLERSLYAALHELQRLQAGRAGADVPPPAVVDVELHGLPEGVG
jgi:hypothetical protein